MLLSMIKLRKVRDLRLSGTTPRRPNYVYSASGLVELNQEWLIIADDELHLAIFPFDPVKPGRWLSLFPGDLPEDYKERKKKKPDLEALTLMPPSSLAPNGALLIVPSLSRPNRIRGALLVLSEEGTGEPIPIDFQNIYSELNANIKELNIEGVVLSKKAVKLFHRGSHGNSSSAIIDLEVSQFERDLHDTHAPRADSIKGIREYDLGEMNGVHLAFTDAAKLADDHIVFLAAAENSKNAYDDGFVAGSAVGILNDEAAIVRVEHIEGALKLEGISAKQTGNQLQLSLVADSDNENIPSMLFASTWVF